MCWLKTCLRLKTANPAWSSPMKTRPLGRTGIYVAPLVLGGNVFGWTADEPTSFAILDRFAEAGVNAIDTADRNATMSGDEHKGHDG